MSGPSEKQTVDISKEAEDLQVYSAGELELLDGKQKVWFRWQRAKTILWLSTGTIVLLLVTSVLVIAFSSDGPTRDWARQIMTALMGFSAGALWTASRKNGGEDE